MAGEINLSNGAVAIVDDEDYDDLARWRWHAKQSNVRLYAARCFCEDGKQKRILMHRWLMGEIPSGDEIHHINGDSLDNRRSNLQVISRSKHNGLRAKRGVPFIFPNEGRWVANIRVGRYDTREEAMAAVRAFLEGRSF